MTSLERRLGIVRMARHPLSERVEDLWVQLAGVATSFPARGVRVVVAGESLLCPPEWCGIVALGAAALATAPDAATARSFRHSMRDVPMESLTDAERWRGNDQVTDVRGPATLAYLREDEFRPTSGTTAVDQLSLDDPDIERLLATVPEAEVAESGIEGFTSSVFVVRDAAAVVALAGYRKWPNSAAHLGVLTRPDARGRGLARTAASAAVAEALRQHMLPQWRARSEPSRRIARSLGFDEIGSQLSIMLGLPGPTAVGETTGSE